MLFKIPDYEYYEFLYEFSDLGLILNPEPYYNEAGYERQKGTQIGLENSRMYNEMAILKMVQVGHSRNLFFWATWYSNDDKERLSLVCQAYEESTWRGAT